MAGADTNCYRVIVIAINFVFFLCGLALIVVGALSLTDTIELFNSKNLGIGLIIMGVFIFFISFLGCFGALRYSRGMLKLYFSLVLLVLIIQFGLAIAAFVYRDDIPSLASDAWAAATPEARTDVQDLFDCCGWSTVTDNAEPPNCQELTGRTQSCQTGVVDAIEENFTAIAASAIVIGVFQLLILVLACCLIQKIPTKQQQEQALLDEARRASRDVTTSASGTTKGQYGSYA